MPQKEDEECPDGHLFHLLYSNKSIFNLYFSGGRQSGGRQGNGTFPSCLTALWRNNNVSGTVWSAWYNMGYRELLFFDKMVMVDGTHLSFKTMP